MPNSAPVVERRYPIIKMDVDAASKLLGRLPGTPAVQAVELLEGGHINSNYLIRFENGEKVVLRICAHGEAAFRKETELLQTLVGSVPVPRLLLSSFEPQFFEHPYMVLQWINGSPLNEVLSAHPEAAAEIGATIALTLLKIGERTLTACPAPPFLEFIRECLFDRDGQRYLSAETAARLWAFVQEKNSFLNDLRRSDVLVHGDFQGDNILLQQSAGKWRIVAVLDWEWASNGCFLRDLGSLIRSKHTKSPAFQQGIEAGFSEQGAPLPKEWRMAASIWDLAPLCEKLAHPKHRGDVTVRSIKTIEQCLHDYGA